MAFQKIPNGDYFFFFNGNNVEKLVKYSGNKGYILQNLRCPSELIGKRVRLKLEIVEEVQ